MQSYKFYTTQHLADMFFVAPNAISRLIRLRELSAQKICGQWRISEEDLQEYLERRKVKARSNRKNRFLI